MAKFNPKVRATQNFIKYEITGRVNYRVHFWENCKKVKNKVTGSKKVVFGKFIWKRSRICAFLGPVTSILTLLQFSQKCARLYRPPRSFCLLWNFLLLKLLSFFFNCWKVKYLRHLYLNHPIFSVNLPVIFIYKFCRKENLIQPLGEPRELNLLNFKDERWNWYWLFIFVYQLYPGTNIS